MTLISPEGEPFASGNRTIRLRPSSSMVVVKSVPRIPIVAVGVCMSIFALFTKPREPEENLAAGVSFLLEVEQKRQYPP